MLGAGAHLLYAGQQEYLHGGALQQRLAREVAHSLELARLEAQQPAERLGLVARRNHLFRGVGGRVSVGAYMREVGV